MIEKQFDKFNTFFKQDDRGTFRLKRILINGISVFGSRGITMLVSIISLPLTINYLGTERFGMMETMVSLITIMNFADLGLGFGLQNRVAELNNSNEKSLHNAVSSVFSVLIITSIIITTLFIFFYSRVSWEKVFNVNSILAKNEVNNSVLIFFVCFIIQIPFSIVQKLQNGFQEGYKGEVWRSIGNICGLCFLVIVVKIRLGVPYIILAIYGSNALLLILNFFYYFLFQRKDIFPNPFKFNKQIFLGLYKDGIIFFGLQMAYIILVSSDRIIISQYLGASAVAVYSIGFRLATIFSTPVDAFTLPLLPAFNDALANNDIAWIKKILSKGFKYILIISSLLCLTLILFGNVIIGVWINKATQLHLSVLISFGFFIIYSNINSLLSYTMLTPIFIKKILLRYIVSITMASFLKIQVVSILGVSGIVWSTIVSMTLFYFTFSLIKLRKEFFY